MNNPQNKKAVVLLSGGLDSTTTLCVAKQRGHHVTALIFDYGQRHKKEIHHAKRIAKHVGCAYKIVKIFLPWKGSALLDRTIAIPKHRALTPKGKNIPPTYVPSRNIVFLSLAASLAETIGAKVIFIGANAIDYSGYPDCRPKFVKAFQKALAHGTKTGALGHGIKIHAPLINKTKAEIISLGQRLKAPYHLTWSCYQGKKRHCGVCDSCRLRKKGFDALKLKDPALS
ncbi:MAG: 7-cyano-7-deazaguanine synthase QueC [Candidatus Omnitrophica bacterium]|nr:7-cyano-7-deazaguanine synthase QueC [Candidatus Omnitrophota bacterium]